MNPTYGNWSTSALFLLPALCMVLPSGYAYGCGLLILVSLFHLKAWREPRCMPWNGWLLYASFVGVALLWLLDDWLSARGGRSFEKPIKILFTLPCMWYMLVRRPRPEWLVYGIAIGVSSACVYTVYGFFWLGIARPSAAMFSIHFGDIVLMLGCMALCFWNWPVQRRRVWRTGLLTVFLLSLFASILSGTRGAWLTLLMLIPLYLGYAVCSRSIKLRHVAAGTLTVFLLLYGLSTMPRFRVAERVAQAHSEVVLFLSTGQANTSVGARLQMWGVAWDLYRQKPVFGWSHLGYIEEQKQRVSDKKIDASLLEYTHPHNDLLNAAAKTGTVGLLGILSIYLAPLFIFIRWFRKNPANLRLRALSCAGMLIPLSYFGFGLTEALLPHNSPIVIYCYLLILLWACCLAVENTAFKGTARGY